MPKAKKVDAANIGDAVSVDTKHAQNTNSIQHKPKLEPTKKQKQTPKHKDPNYAQICVLIPKTLKRDFRQAVEGQESDNSTIIEGLLKDWLNRQ